MASFIGEGNDTALKMGLDRHWGCGRRLSSVVSSFASCFPSATSSARRWQPRSLRLAGHRKVLYHVPLPTSPSSCLGVLRLMGSVVEHCGFRSRRQQPHSNRRFAPLHAAANKRHGRPRGDLLVIEIASGSSESVSEGASTVVASSPPSCMHMTSTYLATMSPITSLTSCSPSTVSSLPQPRLSGLAAVMMVVKTRRLLPSSARGIGWKTV